MTITNLPSALAGFAAFKGQVRLEAVRLHRRVALEVFRPAVIGTPVDTGRHRGEWQAENGSPPEGSTGRLDPAGGPTLSAGVSKIAQAEFGGVTWLVNNGPAILRLEEDGHSPQNRGWVAAAVQSARLRFP